MAATFFFALIASHFRPASGIFQLKSVDRWTRWIEALYRVGVKRRLCPEGSTTALGQSLYNSTCSVFSCLNYLTSGSSSSTTLRINYTPCTRVFQRRLYVFPIFRFTEWRERERDWLVNAWTRTRLIRSDESRVTKFRVTIFRDTKRKRLNFDRCIPWMIFREDRVCFVVFSFFSTRWRWFGFIRYNSRLAVHSRFYGFHHVTGMLGGI